MKETPRETVSDILIALAFGLVGYLFVSAVSDGKPVPHIDAENNVICYTYRNALECMPYNDEGTRLEVMP